MTAHWPDASVLVVDGEPGMRGLLVKAVAPSVGQVLQAGSAEEAAGLLARRRFDLLIVDVMLPGSDGIELLKQLRAGGDGAEVILTTAFADLEMAIEALRAGAGDFLRKPLRAPQLLAAVGRGLERARLRRQDERRSSGDDAPPAVVAPDSVDLATVQRRHIRGVLESVGGDKRRAAQMLGISLRTLERHFAGGGPAGGLQGP